MRMQPMQLPPSGPGAMQAIMQQTLLRQADRIGALISRCEQLRQERDEYRERMQDEAAARERLEGQMLVLRGTATNDGPSTP